MSILGSLLSPEHNKRIKSLAGSLGHQNYAAISLVLRPSLTNRRLSFAAPYAGVDMIPIVK